MDNKTEEQLRWENESTVMHLQKANARLVRLNMIAWLIVGIMVGICAYILFGFNISAESIAIDSHQGAANYIGNDGDIINGGSYGYDGNGGYGYYGDGMSNRRGRAANGRFVSRDGSDMARQLREMMDQAPDEHTRRELQHIVEKMENM